jgi:arylsulfatase A-like enzyme
MSLYITKPYILFLATLLYAWSFSGSVGADQAKQSTTGKDHKRPNFLIILADDLGFSDLGCYGGEIETPHLDSLAAGGLRFTQAYSTARCWPSRAALLTGYYAQQVRRDALPGLGGGGQGKRPAWAKLLPQHLRPLGYRSYHSGKWHIDGNVLDGGFDRSLDVRNQGNFFTGAGNRIDDVPVKTTAPRVTEEGYYSTIATADHAIKCLRDHAESHSEKPFFHYLAFIAPHFPLHALPEDIQRYRDRYTEGWDVLRQQRHKRQREIGLLHTELSPLEREVGPPYHFPDALKRLGKGEVNRPLPWTELTPAQQSFQATKMAIHAAMVDRMDREIGRVLDQLRAMGAFENTIILFASDNGASAEIMVRNGGHDPEAAPGSAASYLCLGPGFSSVANTPLRRHKTWVHEGGISSPMIVHWPQGIAARGENRTNPVHFVDVAPTVMELAGGEFVIESDAKNVPSPPGTSLVAELKAPGSIQPRTLWWLHEGNRAIRVGDWKLVAAKDQPWELYDLSADRAELNDLAGKRPDQVLELSARWQSTTDSMVDALQSEQ